MSCAWHLLSPLVCLTLAVPASVVRRGDEVASTTAASGAPWHTRVRGVKHLPATVCVTSVAFWSTENADPASAEPCQPGPCGEARPSDHICVSLARRATWPTNRGPPTRRRQFTPPAPVSRTPCAPGFVWREAFAGDYVCVTSESRSLVATENADPASAEPCQPGTVWREARPSDHICVSLARRSAVAGENRRAAMRVAAAPAPAPPPGPPPATRRGPAGQTGDLSNDTEYWNQYGFSVTVDRSQSLSDLILRWKCRSERYDSFNVRVRISDGREGQVEVPGGDHGSYRERNAVVGATYTFMVQGCNSGTFSSNCTPWSEVVRSNVKR